MSWAFAAIDDKVVNSRNIIFFMTYIIVIRCDDNSGLRG